VPGRLHSVDDWMAIRRQRNRVILDIFSSCGIEAHEPQGNLHLKFFSSSRDALLPVATKLALVAVAATLAAGCAHLGPKSISVDRFDYSTAIAESWKQQTLLNIVKIRYMDLPVFVDVASIVAGYSMETAVNAGGEFYPSDAASGFATAGVKGTFTDRPTVTYTPLTGEKFLRGVMQPLDPKNIFFMMQSGYAADFVLGLTVDSLNGLRNRSATGGTLREADPGFRRVTELLRDVQAAGGVGMHVVESRGEESSPVGSVATLFFRREHVAPDVIAKTAEIRRLLGLPADGQEFRLVYSPVRGEGRELAVNSRSMLQIMGAFATYVRAPKEHLDKHWTAAMLEGRHPEEGADDPVRILSGKDRPASAYAAVRYRDYWFWIENSDWRTKRALMAIMFFFTLEQGGGEERLPMVTIPAQ